jgi:hypothetical protein
MHCSHIRRDRAPIIQPDAGRRATFIINPAHHQQMNGLLGMSKH